MPVSIRRAPAPPGRAAESESQRLSHGSGPGPAGAAGGLCAAASGLGPGYIEYPGRAAGSWSPRFRTGFVDSDHHHHGHGRPAYLQLDCESAGDSVGSASESTPRLLAFLNTAGQREGGRGGWKEEARGPGRDSEGGRGKERERGALTGREEEMVGCNVGLMPLARVSSNIRVLSPSRRGWKSRSCCSRNALCKDSQR